jgi:molecular chaperone DnaK
MSKIIGIDLGTTNSVVAVMEGNEPKIIVNEEGDRTTPSVVGFDKDGQVLVGSTARRQAVINPEKTVYSSKRFIGSKYSEIKDLAEKVPFSVKKGSGDRVRFDIDGKEYSPPEISAKVLQKLKNAAEDYLGKEVTEAVITVPAYFNDSQRQATKDAGKIAGLEVRRIINEPTAAALAYGLNTGSDELIAVYDFGGGTFDVSVLEISSDVVEVLSTAGDTHLGGDNIDEILIEYLIEEFKNDQGVDVSKDTLVLQRLKEAAEKAKKELSVKPTADINLPFLTADGTGPKHLQLSLSRAKFESMISDVISKTFKACKKVLKDAKKKTSDIDKVILVGGSTRIPKVASEVEKFFGKEPSRGVNPDEVVALGAAVQGGVLSGDVKDLLLLDVTPLSLGIETLGSVTTVLIPRNTTIPSKKSEIFSTAESNQSVVDIHVLQGERQMAPDNRTLGKFQLTGLPPAPRGIPQIEVTFDIDADGIINVSAKDKASGHEQKITITSSGGLTDSEINTMVQEAEQNAEDDALRRESAEARNKLDGMIFSAESSLKQSEDILTDADTKPVTDALETAKAALDSGDKDELTAVTASLESVLHGLARAMYEKQSAAEGESSQETGEVDDDVLEAEVVNS